MTQASQLIAQQYIDGGVVPAELSGQSAASKKYVDDQLTIRDANIASAASAAGAAQADIDDHEISITAHTAQNITYSGEVFGATNVQQGLDLTDTRIDNLVLNTGNSNPEIVDARGGYPVLRDRLDALDQKTVKKGDVFVRVKDRGAKGDGQTDDTAAIQSAIDSLPSTGGIVVLDDGVFMVKATSPTWGQSGGIALKDNVTLFISPSATLKALPNATGNYMIIRVREVSNIIITGGGKIIGDRDEHTGPTDISGGASGHGIDLRGAKNVLISNLYISKCWGDGVHIGYGSTDNSENVIVDNVQSVGNYRQGLSIIGGKKITIRDSQFLNTVGAPDGPCAGIDLEPDNGFVCEDIFIYGCQCNDNAYGIQIINSKRITLRDNTCMNNKKDSHVSPQNDGIVVIGSNAEGILITGNKCISNGNHGIRIDGGTNIMLDGNTCRDNVGHGIFSTVPDTVINNNRTFNNQSSGIALTGANQAVVRGNVSYQNIHDGLNLYGTSGCMIEDNKFHSNSQGASLSWNNISLENSSNDNLIVGNVLLPGSLTNKPNFGVSIYSGTKNFLTHNRFVAGGSGTINDIPGSSIKKDNLGIDIV